MTEGPSEEWDDLGLPMDRTWRHPSELRASATAGTPPVSVVDLHRLEQPFVRRHLRLGLSIAGSAAAAAMVLTVVASSPRLDERQTFAADLLAAPSGPDGAAESPTSVVTIGVTTTVPIHASASSPQEGAAATAGASEPPVATPDTQAAIDTPPTPPEMTPQVTAAADTPADDAEDQPGADAPPTSPDGASSGDGGLVAGSKPVPAIVVLAEMVFGPGTKGADEEPIATSEAASIGLELGELERVQLMGIWQEVMEMGVRLEVDPTARRLIAVSVSPGSPAAEVGLENGDVLLDVGQAAPIALALDAVPILTPADPLPDVASSENSQRHTATPLPHDDAVGSDRQLDRADDIATPDPERAEETQPKSPAEVKGDEPPHASPNASARTFTFEDADQPDTMVLASA